MGFDAEALQSSDFRVLAAGWLRVQWGGVQGSGLRVQRSGCRVQGVTVEG